MGRTAINDTLGTVRTWIIQKLQSSQLKFALSEAEHCGEISEALYRPIPKLSAIISQLLRLSNYMFGL